MQRSFRALIRQGLVSLAISLLLSGCAVVTVVDAAATVVATGVKAVAKTVSAVVDAVIPDGDDKDSK